ncbi:FCD domain-containing protein, partial [Streptomyces sp. NPDC048279]|uniref:FCD domain-containing protein n=1 Tax=Streptomyces sp. NPDC048279 TaxID=3154714 RepID=UPI00343487F8
GVAALESLCAEGEKAVAADDVDAAVALNAAFHAKVMDLAGNAVLAELAAQVDRRVRWYYTPVARQRGRQSWIEHRELIAAITAHDEQLATTLMREHTEHTRRSYHERATS